MALQQGHTSHHVGLPLLSLAQQRPHDAVVVCEGRTTSGAQLLARVAALSRALSSRLGVRPGDPVIVASHNSDRMLEALLAVADAGGVATPINWRWSPHEAAHALRLTAARLAIADAASMPLVHRALEVGGPPSGHASCALCLLGDDSSGAADASASVVQADLPPTPGAPRRPCTEALIAAHSPLDSSARTCHPQPPRGEQHRPAELQLLAPPDGAALAVFTSGTTGSAKAVLLGHAALHVQSLAKLAVVGYCCDDVYLHTAPLFHVGGLSSALAVLMAGGRHVVLDKFSPEAVLAAVQRHAVTAMIAVPTMLQDLVTAAAGPAPTPSGSSHAAPAAATRMVLPSLRRVLVGAGGTSPALQAAVEALCPNASLYTAYGMTEACSSMTFATLRAAPTAGPSCSGSNGNSNVQKHPGAAVAPALPAQGSAPSSSLSLMAGAEPGPGGGPPPGVPAAAACVGLPAPGVQIAVIPGADASGPVGEVVTRGPHVMLGYLNDEVETKKALTPDGWLRTGDLGALGPDGRLWLLGRAKDMVKTGGENVFAPEVEGTLRRHPAVAAACVVGVKDERLGEKVSALVVLHPGWSWQGPSAPGGDPGGQVAGAASAQSASGQGGRLAVVGPEALQQHCRACGLAGFKVPRLVCVAANGCLPCTSMGKVVKPEVRAQLQAVEESRVAAVPVANVAPLPRSRL